MNDECCACSARKMPKIEQENEDSMVFSYSVHV